MLSSSVYVRSRPGRVASRRALLRLLETKTLFSSLSLLLSFSFSSSKKEKIFFVTTCIVFSIRRIPKRGFLLQKIRRKEEEERVRDARKHNNQHVKTAVLKETNVIDRI